MITFGPWEDHGAHAVFAQLDPFDQYEAELVRGGMATHLALWADWRAMQPACIRSHVVAWHGQPFAVLAVSNTGQAGVAQAAFLARDHQRWRRAIGQAGLIIRDRLPAWSREQGIHRIEARCWADHPTAPRFLAALGFEAETAMPGFGATGARVFHQFAFITAHHFHRLAERT